MNQSNIEHLFIAIVIQLAVFAVTGDMWFGAALSTGIFIGREHAQREYEIGNPLNLVGYEALDFWRWSRDAQIDLVLPVAGVVILAVVL